MCDKFKCRNLLYFFNILYEREYFVIIIIIFQADVGAPISTGNLITAIVSNNEYCWSKGLPLVVTNIGHFGYFIVMTLSEPMLRFTFPPFPV